MSKNIRIRTTPGGGDNFIKIKIEQDFDFIEILSLKLSQAEVYRKFCADYGVVAGRVIGNSGFGIPNCKISIFIPISDDDKQNTVINGIYPFEKVTDKDSDGIKYNLLTKESLFECHNPVGTMPSKREFLDNDILIEIYDKYYKFTTTTNNAGDYMLFGVPVGLHTLHMDVDISDIGPLSQRPYDMIRQGSNTKLFESPTKFKSSANLDSLPQIKSSNIGVNIQPFWGDKDNCSIGITRADFNLNYNFEPSAIFMGSVFSDNDKNSVSKTCRPRNKQGQICETTTGEGTIQMIRKTIDGNVERFDVEGGRVIDVNGNWAYQIPMNLNYMITDEFGNLIPSADPSKGIPTEADVRFNISMDSTGGEGRLRTRANYLVPNNPKFSEDADYSFDETTKKPESFTKLKWNKLYTVKNLISRYQPNKLVDNRNFTGIKNVDNCGSHTPFPYNRVDTDFNPLYSIICIIIGIFTVLIGLINSVVITLLNGIIYILNLVLLGICEILKGIGVIICSIINSINSVLGYLGINLDNCNSESFCIGKFSDGNCVCSDIIPYIPCIYLECESKNYAPGCIDGIKPLNEGKDIANANSTHGEVIRDGEAYTDCVSLKLGDNLNVYEFEFYNDWINGSLYLPLLKYKKKRNGKVEKFCDFECGPDFNPSERKNDCRESFILDSCVDDSIAIETSMARNKQKSMVRLLEGIIKKVGDNFYYSSISHGLNTPMFPTDLICLGSTLSCDVDNFPVIHDYLVPTTYKIPEIISDVVVQEINNSIDDINNKEDYGIQPLFFNKVNCISFFVDENNARNINTACELGVELGPPNSTPNLMNNDNISDNIIRRQIIGMSIGNTNFSNINDNFYDNNDKYYKDKNNFTPNNYSNYRNLDNTSNIRVPRGGSFYFYFGIIPGKSALEKANGKYFTHCEILKKSSIIVNSSIKQVTNINGNDGSIEVKVIGDTDPISKYNYQWDNNTSESTTSKITELKAKTYTVIITDKLNPNITAKISLTVTEPLPLSFNYEVTNTKTNNGNDGKIIINNFLGGIAPYTVIINNDTPKTNIKNNDIVSFYNLVANTYTITVKDSSITQLIKSESITVSEPDKLIVSPTFTEIKCFNSSTGAIKINTIGGTPPYNYKITKPDNTITTGTTNISNLSGGTYHIEVKDSIGTTINKDIELVNPSNITCIITPTNITCKGSSSGNIIINTTTGGLEPYLYSIDNKKTWVSTTNFNNLKSGSYNIIVKDSNGCTSQTYNIILKESQTALVNDCSGGTGKINFNASGGWGTYSYKVGSNGGYVSQSDADKTTWSAGNYDTYVRDNGGCEVIKNVTVS